MQSIYDGCGPFLASNKYFLRNYLCYVEIPTYRYEKGTGERKASYDKFLATACLDIAAAWASLDEDTAITKYGKHLDSFDDIDAEDVLVPIVKLGRKQNGTFYYSS